MLQRFTTFAAQQHLFPSGQTVLLAVSGGRDSVVMAHLFHRAGIPFEIAHCNFHLRPGDCDRDEAFVRQLAAAYGVACHVASFDTRAVAAATGESIEQAARRLRYEFFARIITHNNSQLPTPNSQLKTLLATAHHRDDSVETFFLNLFRGTGIAGLHGIRPRSELKTQNSKPITVVHPMLPFSRADIDDYVRRHGLEYVEDYTNSELDARRNRIRHQLMPLLRELYPSVDATMQANIGRLHDTELFYRAYVDQLRASLVKPAASRLPYLDLAMLAIDLRALAATDLPLATLLYELLQPYGFSATVAADIAAHIPVLSDHPPTTDSAQPPTPEKNRVSQLPTTHSPLPTPHTGTRFLSPSHEAVIDRDRLVVAPLLPVVAPQLNTTLSTLNSQLSSLNSPLSTPHTTEHIDAASVRLPLTVRPWQPADRFHPFGMRGSRLVSDFLKDCKLNLIEKRHVHVAVDADGRIVWVIGLRLDDRFRLTETTTDVLSLSVEN